AASALQREGGQGSQNDAAEDQLARAGAEEGVNGVLVGGRAVARPVVEGGVGDAELFGALTLGGMIGISEVVKSVGNGGARPREGVCARWGGRCRVGGSLGSRPRCLLAEPP